MHFSGNLFLAVLAHQRMVSLRWRGDRCGEVTAAVEEAAKRCGCLSEVLCRGEREQFRSPMLANVRVARLRG